VTLRAGRSGRWQMCVLDYPVMMRGAKTLSPYLFSDVYTVKFGLPLYFSHSVVTLKHIIIIIIIILYEMEHNP
jgi:hypothetical protein